MINVFLILVIIALFILSFHTHKFRFSWGKGVVVIGFMPGYLVIYAEGEILFLHVKAVQDE